MKWRHPACSGAIFFILTIGISNLLFAQAPSIQWQKSFGGSLQENGWSIKHTSDGGYILCGVAVSNDGDLTVHYGTTFGNDAWIVKLDSAGNLQWQKSFGGTDDDGFYSVIQTSDGGFIAAGYTASHDVDVTYNHGAYDAWIVKLDESGNMLWQKTYGGSYSEAAFAIRQTIDGGYIVSASSESNDGDVTVHHGLQYYADFWILKLTENGTLAWQKSYGGDDDDYPISIEQTSDSGYIIAGSTRSVNGDVSINYGLSDFWIVKVDADGELQWEKSIGGSNEDGGWSIKQTFDGGYIACGLSQSKDNGINVYGGYNYLVVKTNSEGVIKWEKTYGGGSDAALSVLEKEDSTFTIAGYTGSNNHDVTGFHGGDDYWLIHINQAGTILWEKTYGGSGYEDAQAMDVTDDGGYILTGFTSSSDQDVSANHGGNDIWVLKLSPADDAHLIKNSFTLADTICPGKNFVLNYAAMGNYNSGNVFTAQLSDPYGNFNSPVNIGAIASTGSGQIQASIPAVEPGASYKIRVVSSNPSVTGIINSHELSILCPTPVPLISHVTTSSVKLKWNGVGCGINYIIRYKVKGTLNYTKIATSNTSYILSGLNPGTEYIWSVATECSASPNAFSFWPQNQTFMTPPLKTGNESEINSFTVQLYPNPVTDELKVKLETETTGEVTISNMVGEIIFKGSFSENMFSLNVSSLVPGLYLLRLKMENQVMTKTFVKQ